MDNISVLDVFSNNQKVGRLALTEDFLCAFEYDSDFLKSGYSISPYFLPLRSGLFIAERDPFDGGFGVFDDSLPDGWGNLVLDRYLQEKGINPNKLTILQRLSLIGSSGRGALEYRPDNAVMQTSDFTNFNKLAKEVNELLKSNKISVKSLDYLYEHGGSSGGARPKIFVKMDNKEWLVKFKSREDADDIGKIEYEYALRAKEFGIDMPEVRLIEKKYFAVERFDRSSSGKIHTVSASGLLNAFYRIPSLDYLDLLKLTRALTNDMGQVFEMFRRMVFNVLISNKDDHSKNFSFQFRNGKWKLSPAYDILTSSGFNGYHTTTINNKGAPSTDDMLALGLSIGLNKKRCQSLFKE